MRYSRRRLLLAGASLGLLGAGLASCGPDNSGSSASAQNNESGPATPTPPAPPANVPVAARIRYDVASDAGKAMLQVYAGAVAAMMARPEGDPLNWDFQWYSHWVKGDLDASGKTAEMARIYGAAPSAARTLAQKMWDGCQAHGPSEDEDFFLPWHRMFVFAFENIIRAVSGNANFTLPYWDYTTASEFAIPPQFRLPDDPTWGSLYRSARNPGVNDGQPISNADTLNLAILSETSYSANGGDAGFCAGLDNGLHGAVHVSVGDATGGMGVVPWAANDPLFWLHHCNIDRIWASWNAAGHANPTDSAFLAKPFPFADASGAEIDYVVSNFMDVAAAGYGYDQLAGEIQPQVLAAPPVAAAPAPLVAGAPPPPPSPQARMALRALKAAPVVTHAAQDVSLSQGGVRVTLAQAAAAPDSAARAVAPLTATSPRFLKRTLSGAPPMVMSSAPATGAAPAPPSTTAAPKPGQHTFIVLSDLATAIQPGVIYSVYLEAPRAGGSPQQYLVGSLNFFSAMGPGMRMSPRKISFDITELATQLAQEKRLSNTPVVVFVPNGTPPSEAKPLIGSLSLVVQ